MSSSIIFAQLLNGFQFGILLFLLSAGLTLVLGIMNFVNLAHGSLFMAGAYFSVAAYNLTGSFIGAVLLGIAATMLLGFIMERLVLAKLYARDHLYQVLATFGLILLLNELVTMVWGRAALYAELPSALSGTVNLFGLHYSAYRASIIVVGLIIGLALYWMINKTRVGMLIRAGASDAPMVSALGVNIKLVNLLVFCAGAGLAGLSGLMAAPILSVQSGMGDPVLILTLVVIVTGGIGSIRGAFYGALIIGMVETLGRAFLPLLFRAILDPALAQVAGPAVASVSIYILMIIVLAMRPQGLFPVRHG
ncbi:MAG TPA: branched-chain amino acid ABC transporter permease [Eoetvoesiella sp.]|uniref:branched-chain amino acid ABC transporter permease n=1 Tax=Eoetvoesiella sp. TaxID=1966355 RepID=UPI002BEBEC88|nr:branched-chain amino acid ABC transporter permease [Eoetvoesiella sp.]HWK60837.1 branched-chain amino acid ABC transporter permease [Eoetvoesiella sp.]